jgi:hypothetical protein
VVSAPLWLWWSVAETEITEPVSTGMTEEMAEEMVTPVLGRTPLVTPAMTELAVWGICGGQSPDQLKK